MILPKFADGVGFEPLPQLARGVHQHMVGSIEHLRPELQVLLFPAIGKYLMIETSSVPRHGPLRLLREQFPNVPAAVLENAAGLNQPFWLALGRTGSTPATQLSRVALVMKFVPAGIPGRCGVHPAALQRGDGAELPAAHHLVHDASVVEEALALAEWQRVKDGSHESMRNMESRRAFFAREGAARILGREVGPTVPRMLLAVSRDLDHV